MSPVLNWRSLSEATPRTRSNTVAQTAVNDTAGVLLAANAARKGLMVQNTGTTVLKLAFGAQDPTQTAYHIALKAAAGADDGSGAIYIDDAWVGEVRIIGSAGGGTCVVLEIVET
jgi:hypothetical protein